MIVVPPAILIDAVQKRSQEMPQGEETAQIVGGKVSRDGVLTSAAGKGTYSLASNCLGIITFISNTGKTLRYNLSVTSGGKEANFILGLDGVTLTGSAKKQ